VERYCGLVIVIAVVVLTCSSPPLPPAAKCKKSIKEARWKDAIEQCRVASTNPSDLESMLQLARVYLQLGQYDDALRISTALFDTTAQATAKQIAGTIYNQRGEPDLAKPLLQDAFSLHRAEGEHDEAARDAHALSGLYFGQRLFLEAVQALDDCLIEAEASHDEVMMGYAHLAMGSIMSDLGDAQAAEWAFQQAEKGLNDGPNNRSWWALKMGVFYQDTNQYAQSEFYLREAIRLATEASRNDVLLGAQRSLALTLTKMGRFDEAQALLGPEDSADVLYTKALLAREKNDLKTCAELLARFAKNPPNRSWEIASLYQQGRTASMQGDLKAAEVFYQTAVKRVEELRRDAGTEELRAWLLAEHRGPYEALFALFASQGRSQEALSMLESMHARAFLDQFLHRDVEVVNAQQSALRANSLREFLTRLRRSPVSTPVPAEQLIKGLASLDILAYQEADGRLWSVRVFQGAITFKDLGDAKKLYQAADAFSKNPDDEALAEAAGDSLISSWEASETPLYVITEHRLSRIPFAALRRAGRFLIEDRPLVFAPSLSALMPSSSSFEGAPLVVGAPTDDLPAARKEAEQVAQIVGVSPVLGAAATQAQLASSKGSRLLHLATHVKIGPAGGAIQMADKEVSASDVVSLGLNGEVVVLAGCASAVARSEEQWGSLAMSFLANGSHAVVASLRSVDDEKTRRLFSLFYQNDWRHSVTALANAQRSLAKSNTPPNEWAFFAVYGVAAHP
jgi:tetratricopeptide (TPR) repeat protein